MSIASAKCYDYYVYISDQLSMSSSSLSCQFKVIWSLNTLLREKRERERWAFYRWFVSWKAVVGVPTKRVNDSPTGQPWIRFVPDHGIQQAIMITTVKFLSLHIRNWEFESGRGGQSSWLSCWLCNWPIKDAFGRVSIIATYLRFFPRTSLANTKSLNPWYYCNQRIILV